MDQFTKRSLLAGQVGRNLRSMSMQGLLPILNAGGWFPAVDVYEIKAELIVYMDVSGADPRKLSVVAEEQLLTVTGERQYPVPNQISCIHQLEIERGFFERAVPLPKPIDVSKATSQYSNGFLIITLPLQRRKGKVSIKIS
ncbi:Hsp20/alpha crystallin family protein [Thiovibrio sp. JS02]